MTKSPKVGPLLISSVSLDSASAIGVWSTNEKQDSDLAVASPPLGVKGDPVRVQTLVIPPSHHLCQDKIVNRKKRSFFKFPDLQ